MRVAITATLLLFLAGCAFSEQVATLSHEGTGEAYRDSSKLLCSDAAILDGSGSILAGNLTVRVLDGKGAVAFEDTYEAPIGGQIQHALIGAPGNWKLEASSAHFEGTFTLTLTC